MFLQTSQASVNDQHELTLDGVSLVKLKEKYGTPLYIMSEGHIRQQMNTLKTQFLDRYPNVLPLFASKSFSCLAIYRLASEYGIGVDCVSAGEISIALKAGFDPEKIYFHGNNKLPSEIRYALSHGVNHFVVDNFYELELCEQIGSELDQKIYATVRVTPGVESGAHVYIQTGAKDTKFGFSSHDDSYLKAVEQILKSNYIVFEGLHCHIGSQIFDLQAYISAMEKFVQFALEIKNRFGVTIRKLNAGGGFGIAYHKDDHPLDFDVITAAIMSTIQTGFMQHDMPMPMVLIEPGRFVVGNAGITLYEIGSYKDIPGVRKYISVDGGMNDNIRTALYDAKYEAVVVNKADAQCDTLVTVAGKNCESGDILIRDILLADPQPGDLLAIFSTGAYNYTMSSNYNQIPRPPVVFTYEGKDRLVVRGQTFDDLVLFDVEEDES